MNNTHEPMDTGAQENNLPETLGPSVTENTEIPDELKALHQQPLETYEEPVDQERAPLNQQHDYQPKPFKQRPHLKKDEIKNFAQMRLQMEQLQRERDEALRKLKDRNDIILGDDDIAEGKHLNRVQQEIKNLKEELVQTRIKAQYADFDTIVNVDTLAALRDNFPELAATLQDSKDLYTQASAAYTLIKKLGIVPDEEVLINRNRIHNNTVKPRPASSVGPQQGDSPLTKANAFAEGLTEDLKKQLFKEMQQARKAY